MKPALLLPVLGLLLASCTSAGKGTMTVVSRSPEGIAVSAEWSGFTMKATKSAVKAQEWFAREATKLAQAEHKPVSTVHLQGATLKYNGITGICKASLRGAAYFGGNSSGSAGFFDGSNLMTQARNEDIRIAEINAKLLAFSAAMNEVTAENNRRNIENANEMARFYQAQASSRQSYSSNLSNFSLPRYEHRPLNLNVQATRMTYSPPPTRLLSFNGSGSSQPGIPTLSSTPSRISTYSPSNNMGLSSGLSTRSGSLSGNTYYHPSGATSTRSGNTWFHPGGTTTTRVGNTITSSTGATSKKQGNTWFHSNGKTSTQTGNTIHNSDGTSYTVSPSGTMYLNGKGLSGN